jgi:hypothetical protein
MMKRALLLNGIAIVGVLLSHSMYWAYTALAGQTGTPMYYVWLTLQQLPVFAVPVFIFVSGFFFAFTLRGHIRPDPKVLATRVISLIVPYLIWSLAIIGGKMVAGQAQSLDTHLVELISTGVHGPYYFVPLLIQLYSLAYVVSPAVVTYPWKLLLLSALVQWGVIVIWYLELVFAVPALDFLVRVTPYWVCLRYVSFFIFGFIVYLKRADMKRFVQRHHVMLGITTLGLALGAIVGPEILYRTHGVNWRNSTLTLSGNFYATVFILWFLSIRELPAGLSRQIQCLAGSSYGLFLAHGPIMGAGARVLRYIVPRVLTQPLVFGGIVFVLSLGGSLFLMEVLRRTRLRGVYRLVFG